jgi:hypothetical protein
MVVAPGRMIDSFLSIPDAESLPLYRMVLKLACVHTMIYCQITVYHGSSQYIIGVDGILWEFTGVHGK